MYGVLVAVVPFAGTVVVVPFAPGQVRAVWPGAVVVVDVLVVVLAPLGSGQDGSWTCPETKSKIDRTTGPAASAPKPACSSTATATNRGSVAGPPATKSEVSALPVTCAVPVLPNTGQLFWSNPVNSSVAVPPRADVTPSKPSLRGSYTSSGMSKRAITASSMRRATPHRASAGSHVSRAGSVGLVPGLSTRDTMVTWWRTPLVAKVA